MNQLIRRTALAALLLAALPSAHAAVQSYNFNGTLDSGAFNGQGFSGSFSFDDAALTSSGAEWLTVGSLSLNFRGSNYTLAHADVPAEVAYLDGAFLGLSYSYSVGDPSFSLVYGSIDSSDAFIAYDTSLGTSGAGSIVYAPIPEPETYAMMLAGLGLLGLAARRRKQRQAS